MRLLHTSDWHVGRFTYDVSRRPDHEAVFAEIVGIARDFAPDIIVHTGDFFDASMPAVDDLRFGVEMLEQLSEVAPTIVVCGNHENPKLFALFDRLRGSERLRFIDKPRSPASGGILEYGTRAGERIRLAPLPFVRNTAFVSEFGDPGAWSSVYGDNIAHVESVFAAALAACDHRRDVNVFAAHLHVTGAVLANSERRVHVDDFGTKPESIPPVSYAAFGHIHKPQEIAGRPWARYAGSPIGLDFGEEGERKSVVLVEAAPGDVARVELTHLGGGRPLRRVRGTLEALEAASASLAGTLALVTVDGPALPGLADRVATALPNTTVLRVATVDPNHRIEAVESGDPAAEPPIGELFATFVAESGASDADNARIVALFADAARAVAAQERLVFSQFDDGEGIS